MKIRRVILLLFFINLFCLTGCIPSYYEELSFVLSRPSDWGKIREWRCRGILADSTCFFNIRLQAAIGLKIKGCNFNQKKILLREISKITCVEDSFWSGVYLSFIQNNQEDAVQFFVLSLIMDPVYVNLYSKLVEKICPDVYNLMASPLNYALFVTSGDKNKYSMDLSKELKHDGIRMVYDFYNGMHYLQNKDWDSAHKAFQKVSEPWVFTYIADAYWMANKMDEAEIFYKKAIISGDVHSYYFLALLYRSLERYSEAEEIARQGIRYDSRNRYMILEVLRLQNKLSKNEGEQIIGKVSREESLSFLDCFFLGNFYRDQNEIAKAIFWYERASMIQNEHDARPLKELLNLYKQKGEVAKAQKIEEKLLNLNNGKENPENETQQK